MSSIGINVNGALAYSEIRVGLDVGGLYNRVDDLGLYDGTNPYDYVHANPLYDVDPEGLFSTKVMCANPVNAAACAAGMGAKKGAANSAKKRPWRKKRAGWFMLDVP